MTKHRTVVKFRKPRKIPVPPVLDQVLRAESHLTFHPRKYFSVTIELPCSKKPEKSLSRIVRTIEKPIPGLELARTTVLQFVCKSTKFENGLIKIGGQIIADREIPEIVAIKLVRESVEKWLKDQS